MTHRAFQSVVEIGITKKTEFLISIIKISGSSLTIENFREADNWYITLQLTITNSRKLPLAFLKGMLDIDMVDYRTILKHICEPYLHHVKAAGSKCGNICSPNFCCVLVRLALPTISLVHLHHS